MSPDKAWQQVGDNLRLSVRLTPSGGRDAVDGQEHDADGQAYLKARVTAVPENGKANKALVALLSKALKQPKSSISFISGETSRKKILRLDGEPEDLERFIIKWKRSAGAGFRQGKGDWRRAYPKVWSSQSPLSLAERCSALRVG